MRAISNANGSATAFDLLGLTQTIDLVQGNAIGSSIEIHNHGGATGDDTGLIAEINHRTIGSLANNAVGIGPGLSNANGTVEAIGLADLAQVINLNRATRSPAIFPFTTMAASTPTAAASMRKFAPTTIGSLANNATGWPTPTVRPARVILAQITQSIQSRPSQHDRQRDRHVQQRRDRLRASGSMHGSTPRRSMDLYNIT